MSGRVGPGSAADPSVGEKTAGRGVPRGPGDRPTNIQGMISVGNYVALDSQAAPEA